MQLWASRLMLIAPLAQWIARWTSNPKGAGSSPAGGMALAAAAPPAARLAQSVARGSHNPKVVSSILAPRNVLQSALWQKAPEGFEPSTLRLLGVRSNQLSYGATASFRLLPACHRATAVARWPSGLRRCVKAAISSEAWVRTPPSSLWMPKHTPARIRTRVARFKVWSANHYTTGAAAGRGGRVRS